MLVFTAFYSPELPFIFYSCQQLRAQLKRCQFTVTNCHRLPYFPGVTRGFSHRDLSVIIPICSSSLCSACERTHCILMGACKSNCLQGTYQTFCRAFDLLAARSNEIHGHFLNNGLFLFEDSFKMIMKSRYHRWTVFL